MTGLTPNQSAKLVAKGRMKAIGVSWTEEEAVAISKCSPADREALIAKLRNEKKEVTNVNEPSEKVDGQLATPEEIKAQKEKEKADKKAKKEAEKAAKNAEKEEKK